MKWSNRQYVDLLTYRGCDRPMFSELFGPIIGLPEQWREQGATQDMIDLRAFAFDYVPYKGIGHMGATNCPKEIVLEDNEQYYVAIDRYGRRVRMCKATATIPLPETFPVETMDDWLRIKHMFVYDDSRVSQQEIDEARALQAQGTLITLSIPGGFDILRELMGEVNCCLAFYDDPELVRDILGTISDTNVRVLKKLALSRLAPDQLSVHEDMAGKTAPMIGPGTVKEYIRSYYLDAWNIARQAGTRLFCQDSDGNMNPLIDAFIDSGVNVFYPCEPAGNMDIVSLRKKYGHNIAFKGGIDKFALRKSKADIDRELQYKLQPCILEGGIVLGLDHRILNGTPLENYIYYVDRARELLGMDDFRTSETSWGRMGF